MTETKTSTLDKLSNWARGHMSAERDLPFNVTYRRLILSPSGLGRLAHTIGILTGLAINNREAAEKLADDLSARMNILGDYGGSVKVDGTAREMPAFKIVIHDDGLLGSFNILWYSLVDPVKLQEEINKGIDEDNYVEHRQAIYDKYRINVDLKEWMPQGPDLQYAFRMNGGLIMHWDNEDLTTARWSIHT